jgi:hypothetical protein
VGLQIFTIALLKSNKSKLREIHIKKLAFRYLLVANSEYILVSYGRVKSVLQ